MFSNSYKSTSGMKLLLGNLWLGLEITIWQRRAGVKRCEQWYWAQKQSAVQSVQRIHGTAGTWTQCVFRAFRSKVRTATLIKAFSAVTTPLRLGRKVIVYIAEFSFFLGGGGRAAPVLMLHSHRWSRFLCCPEAQRKTFVPVFTCLRGGKKYKHWARTTTEVR